MLKQLLSVLLVIVGLFLQTNTFAAYLPETGLINDGFSNSQFINASSFTSEYDVDINSDYGENISEIFVHASILGTGNGHVDFFSFRGNDGKVFLDIDYGRLGDASLDTSMALYNAKYELIAFNDDAPRLYSGSSSLLDSFIGHKLEDGYIYYLAVGQQYALDGIAQGAEYTLHISMTPSPVPVPVAIWLFASGLLALFGFSRLK